jgi:hypothetical protein
MTMRIPYALALFLTAGMTTSQARPNLSGHWVLRPAPGTESADSTAADTVNAADSTALPMDTATVDSARADTAAEGMEGREREGEEGRRQSARRGPDDQERQQLARLAGMSQPVQAFTIEQSDSGIVVTNADGFSYTLHPDNQRRDVVFGSDTLRVRAHWDEGSLVAEYEPRGGGKLTERYTLAMSKQYLRLDVTVEHKALYRPAWRVRMYRKDDS